MPRFRVTHRRPRAGRSLATAAGIGGILALSMGTGTLHAQAATTQTTTTSMASSSASNTSALGAAVTLTATVVPAGTAPVTLPTGTVQFMDGTINLGTASAVTAGTPVPNGTASLVTSALTAGSHRLTAVYSGDPKNAGSTSAVLTQVVSANMNFIHAAYTTMLGHDANSAGLSYWMDQLDNLGAPRSNLASYLAMTPEYRNLVISGNGQPGNDFYHLYLQRAFDPAGAAYWVDQMAAPVNMTFEQVRLRFVGSSEFFATTSGGNQTMAIENLYQSLLGRHSDPAGLAYWQSHFNVNIIAAQFLFSQEGRTFLVNNLYHQILNRTANGDPGQGFWTNALLGGASDENIIASILGSTEYFTNHH